MATIKERDCQQVDEKNTSGDHLTAGASNTLNNPDNEPTPKTEENQNARAGENPTEQEGSDPRMRWRRAMDYVRNNGLQLVNTVFRAARCVFACVDCVNDSEEPEMDATQFFFSIFR